MVAFGASLIVPGSTSSDGRPRVKATTDAHAERYLRPKEGDAVLDIGCGTSEILKYISSVTYTGYDTNLDFPLRGRPA